jgi:hypothetical protein
MEGASNTKIPRQSVIRCLPGAACFCSNTLMMIDAQDLTSSGR